MYKIHELKKTYLKIRCVIDDEMSKNIHRFRSQIKTGIYKRFLAARRKRIIEKLHYMSAEDLKANGYTESLLADDDKNFKIICRRINREFR